MALMGWREANRARWVGVRPAHYGEQVAVSSVKSNGTQIVYTVPAGKVFHLCALGCVARETTGASGGTIGIRNAADVVQYQVFEHYPNFASIFTQSIPFNPPLEIPAGFDVYILSTTLTLIITCFLFGWIDDA